MFKPFVDFCNSIIPSKRRAQTLELTQKLLEVDQQKAQLIKIVSFMQNSIKAIGKAEPVVEEDSALVIEVDVFERLVSTIPMANKQNVHHVLAMLENYNGQIVGEETTTWHTLLHELKDFLTRHSRTKNSRMLLTIEEWVLQDPDFEIKSHLTSPITSLLTRIRAIVKEE